MNFPLCYYLLQEQEVNIIETNLDWDAFEWGPTSVKVKGLIYPLTTVEFVPITSSY